MEREQSLDPFACVSVFYTHLYMEAAVTDDEGADHVSPAVAVERAIAGIREIIAEQICAGDLVNLAHYAEITDGRGQSLCQIRFRDVITIVDQEG